MSNDRSTRLSESFDPQARAEIAARTTGCIYCGSKSSLQYDHVQPVSRGGHGVAANGALACERCNRAKFNKPLIDFLVSERAARAREVHMLDTALILASGEPGAPLPIAKSKRGKVGRKADKFEDYVERGTGLMKAAGPRCAVEMVRFGVSHELIASRLGLTSQTIKCCSSGRTTSEGLAKKIARVLQDFGSEIAALDIYLDTLNFDDEFKVEDLFSDNRLGRKRRVPFLEAPDEEKIRALVRFGIPLEKITLYRAKDEAAA